MSVHLAATVLYVIAGALFLLAAFGTGSFGNVALVPLAGVFTVGGLAVDHHHHH